MVPVALGRGLGGAGSLGSVESDPSADAVLAIDIGGTKIAAGVVDRDGHLAERRQQPTEGDDADALYRHVLTLASKVRDSWRGELVAIGVGCGGPARDHHRLMSPLNIAVWRDFPLRDRLSSDLGLPCHVDNDAKALALAEGWRGAARGVSNYIAMVVSTGVGGGIVLDGRLLDGADGNAGHIGHVFVEADGHPDAAGVRGLLEGSASGTGIAGATGRPAAEADDALRRQVGIWVGRAVASVANLLDLQLAVVAGSVALGYGAPFFEAAQETLDDLCRIDHAVGTRIVPAGLGDEAPLIGAGAVAWRRLGVPVLG